MFQVKLICSLFTPLVQGTCFNFLNSRYVLALGLPFGILKSFFWQRERCANIFSITYFYYSLL